MKLTIVIFQLFLFCMFNSICSAQTASIRSLGEISFRGCNNVDQFNKMYILGPGGEVMVKNYCDEEIAIGLKKYLDISNDLALVYQQRDSITIGLISQYEVMNSLVNEVSGGLTTISDRLKNISDLNLQPSIDMLYVSNDKLKNSNAKLDLAIGQLEEINSDISKIQVSSFWKYAGFFGGGVLVGVLVAKIK